MRKEKKSQDNLGLQDGEKENEINSSKTLSKILEDCIFDKKILVSFNLVF